MAEAEPITVEISDDVDTIQVDPDTGTITELQPDGSVKVQLDAKKPGFGPKKKDDDDWFENLVEQLDGLTLSTLKNDLIEGIKADDQSRQGKLNDTARGLELLGLALADPDSDVSDAGTGPQISKVTNPLLLEAILKAWANAEAELLPADGPAKVKSSGMESGALDEQAEILEKGFNHFLTETATEYYPETAQMLLWGTTFTGAGFKKTYRCPMRRRVVSEMVEVKDLIVSDTSKDFRSCGRITHQISMRPSVYKRMQLIGAYKDVKAPEPNPTPNAVDAQIAEQQGTDAVPSRPEDKPYTIWESQCELDLDEFIPEGSKFKGAGIPLPYLVTIDKDNEIVLAIRRDWDENDEQCHRLRMYTRYPYIPGPGFYCTGLLNMLGNSSAAMTAAWRISLDAGMFANFPAGFVAENAARQTNTTIDIGPGQFKPLKTAGMKIQDLVMDMPFKDVTAGMMSMMDKITQQSKELGQSVEIPTGEGVQNIPVGTMLALIEQSTKVMAAAHKLQHKAQSEEFAIIMRHLRAHPEDLLNDDDNPVHDYEWDNEKLLAALQNVKLVPVSDPNVPSHIHRIAKAVALGQMLNMPKVGDRLSADEVTRRMIIALREDPAGLIVQAPPAAAAPPDLAGMAKLAEVQQKPQELASKERIEQMKLAGDDADRQAEQKSRETDLAKELIIHAADQEKIAEDREQNRLEAASKIQEGRMKIMQNERQGRIKAGLELVKAGTEMHQRHQENQLAREQHQLDVGKEAAKAGLEANRTAIEAHKALNPPKPAPSGGSKRK